jgi:mgtE-like transporter
MTLLIVNSVIFIFKKINYLFYIPKFVGAKFNLFFKDSSSTIKESIIALLFCSVGGLFAGIILGNMTYFLEAFPGLMVLIPGAIGMRGNIFGALGSRLGSNLHIGTLSPEFKRSKILSENILSSLVLTVILSVFLAFLAKGVCILFNFESMSLFDFTLISVFAGVISSIVMLPLTMFISLKSFENGLDPDNVSTPIIAAFGDLFTLPSIILAIFLVTLFSDVILKYILFTIVILFAILGFHYGTNASDEMRRIIMQSTPVLLISSALGISAGGFLNSSIDTLIDNPSLLTLIPLFSGGSGNLVSILGARFSSALHAGLIQPILKPEKITVRNFLIIIILAIIIYPTIGFLAELSALTFGGVGLGFFRTISISTISGMILISIMLLLVFYISTLSYKKGLDPDNIIIPISTSTTDSISSLILITVALAIIHLFAI